MMKEPIEAAAPQDTEAGVAVYLNSKFRAR
jgi:hypothetical protein